MQRIQRPDYSMIPLQDVTPRLPMLRLTLDHLKRLKLSDSYNQALAQAANKDFFEQGEGGIAQLKSDCLEREFLIKLTRHFGMDIRSVARFNLEENHSIIETLKSALITWFGADKAEDILKAHSQGPGGFIGFVSGWAFPPNEDSTITIKQPENPSINLDMDEDGEIYIDVKVDMFPIISRQRGNECIGAIPGPLSARYKLISKKQGIIGFRSNNWGYQLEYIESPNPDLIKIFRGEKPNENEIQARYCNLHQVYQLARSDLKKCLQDERMDETLKQHAKMVLEEADRLQQQRPSNADTRKLTQVLRDTTSLINLPREYNEAKYARLLNQYKQDAETISRRSGWKIFGGVMLCLVGVAAIGLSGFVAAASLGALSPFSIGGIVFGASALAAGISLGTGVTLGVGSFIGSGLLFYKSKPPLRTAMSKFAETIEVQKPAVSLLAR
jgi:hypothetical protein